jgi:L-cysteate sulfo-lyase
MLTNHLPRVSLAHIPTPLEEMLRLQHILGGPRLLIKRDDQTGLATGGNKTRKLEFLLAEALEQKADTLITAGGPQSNHCRQVAAAAAKLGLRCVVVLGSHPIPRSNWNGNLLLNHLLGAEIRWGCDRDWYTALAEEAEILKTQGCRLYEVTVGGSVPAGAVGYVAAIEEVAQQLAERKTHLDRIVLATGSAGTQAGLLVGIKALRLGIRVEGMNVQAIHDIKRRLVSLTKDTGAYLDLTLDFSEDEFILHDACGTHSYGMITDAEREATHLIARSEGIIVDPIYTGRALGGMVERIRKGIYEPNETILFWHTGGASGLFPRATDMVQPQDAS